MTITSNNAILQRTIVSGGVMYIFRQVVIGSSLPTNPKQQVLYIVGSVMKYWNGSAWITLGGGSAVWGGITGILSAQTDLQNALNAKANANNVLAKDNTNAFTPDADYEPSTKKYVDDIAIAKVDKVTGKQLSTEDYTTAEKNKLASVVIPAYQTVTIAVADWSGGTTCTKTVSGVTATTWNSWAFAESYRAKIIQFDVRPSGQGAGTITFTADSTPDADIVFIVQIKPV